VPNDITVSRQVLAEPDATLATRTWASLEDGTPLVTGERRGKGLVSLFHVSADMRWSDLPMSGTFVEMLRRIVDLAGYASNPDAAVTHTANAETVAASARSARRPRPQSPSLLTSAIGRHRIIRRDSMARPTGRSR
jgi:hypothetical protein